jgi:hypothetical protein
MPWQLLAPGILGNTAHHHFDRFASQFERSLSHETIAPFPQPHNAVASAGLAARAHHMLPMWHLQHPVHVHHWLAHRLHPRVWMLLPPTNLLCTPVTQHAALQDHEHVMRMSVLSDKHISQLLPATQVI